MSRTAMEEAGLDCVDTFILKVGIVENDLDETERLVIPVGVTGRLDQWLAGQRPELSRSRWQKLLREGGVYLDDESADPRTKIREGQVVSILRSAVQSVSDPVLRKPKPENVPLRVLFEDEAFMAIDKAPGMVVHAGNGCSDGTVVNAALHHCGALPDLGDPLRPGIVHRIDRETSGVLLIAKTEEAGRVLQGGFRDRTHEKTYLAVAQGSPETDAGTIDRPIGRHPQARTRMAEVEGGRHAVTHWEIIRRSEFQDWCALKVKIETGRTHQIRVHLASRGHPLLGDRLYGYRPAKLKGSSSPQRVLLHAWRIVLPHPLDGTRMILEAPPPADLQDFL